MKCIIRKNPKGFTLIEIIIVMVLLGIIAAVAGMGFVKAMEGMVFTKANASTIQKGQVTITKLAKEFLNISISSITAANATSITFKTIKNGTPGAAITVAVSDNKVYFGNDILTDQVSQFTLKYYSDTQTETAVLTAIRVIEITMKLTGANGVASEFKARVKPRNL